MDFGQRRRIETSTSAFTPNLRARSVSGQPVRSRRKPELILEEAIVGMLPHTKLGRAMASKLKVYAGGTHPHAAQQPKNLAL